MDKKKRLNELYDEYAKQFEGKDIVLGYGDIDARFLLIGEAPGKDEVRLKKPFVGIAGRNLNEFLEVLGLKREDIYITNAIKYRLSKVNPKSGKIINRPAAKNDIQESRQYLINEIEIISPDYIVTMGNVPLNSVVSEGNMSIGQVHGETMFVTLGGRSFKLFPIYHPASVIYNRSLKDTYMSDLEKLRNIIKS